MSWTLELSYNLLSIILLARKSIEVYLKKTDQSLKIIINEKVFSLADIIENQYVIQLV